MSLWGDFWGTSTYKRNQAVLVQLGYTDYSRKKDKRLMALLQEHGLPQKSLPYLINHTLKSALLQDYRENPTQATNALQLYLDQLHTVCPKLSLEARVTGTACDLEGAGHSNTQKSNIYDVIQTYGIELSAPNTGEVYSAEIWTLLGEVKLPAGYENLLLSCNMDKSPKFMPQ